MSRVVERTPQADEDLADIYAYIAIDNAAAARRFLLAAERTFNLLAEAPAIGREYPSSRPRLRGLPMWPISGFRAYLVSYVVRPGVVKVIRVLHGARDLPGILTDF